MTVKSCWLALGIGNSRLHWGYFVGDRLQHTWDTPHLSPALAASLIAQGWHFPTVLSDVQMDEIEIPQSPELWIASVVPAQTQIWQQYERSHILTLDDIPLQAMYPTLGIDRALGLWAAGETYGWPVLLIDAGTALTFTGGSGDRTLIGGAILPGWGLQCRSLSQQTAQLPQVDSMNEDGLPPRWSQQTSDAIASGILYTLLAGLRDFISDWRLEFPESAIVLTGGDAPRLFQALQMQAPAIAAAINVDRHIVFQGIQRTRQRMQKSLGEWGRS